MWYIVGACIARPLSLNCHSVKLATRVSCFENGLAQRVHLPLCHSERRLTKSVAVEESPKSFYPYYLKK